MRLGVKFLGNNNRSDILLLGVVNDLCKKQKKKSTYKMFIKAYRPQSFELLLLITVSKFCFNFPYDWFRKLASPSRPIKCKTETSITWITRVFPAFHRLLAIFPFALIGCCDYSGFGLISLNRKEPEMVF